MDNIKNLIVTAAGLSTRFEGLNPKWMLTHPSGRWMIVEALSSVDFSVIDKVYFGFLQEHLDKYNCIDGIKLCFKELGIEDKAELVALNSPTDNQPHTVYEVIKQANVKGSVLIKEVDNYFRFDVASQYFKDSTDNFMTYFDLNNTTSINPSNKSYVKFDTDENITDVVEKRVFSSTFGCGCYSFNDVKDYCKYFEKLSEDKGLYISYIIKNMIEDGHKFKAVEATDYVDWGTKEDWFNYVRRYKTLFVDLDGTLVESSGKYNPPYWGDTPPITENVEFLNKLYNTGKVYIIITTARPSTAKDVTLKQLEKYGILYHDIIFNLFHANRTIINDYGSSNPYPTCDAVNIPRNSNSLERYLKDLGL
ncbi:hypothetical protein HOE22_05430 [Candidatus Woesearchaeota archaeon]|jgi:hypothetical protein|nr:hypothetical protein [Candidatus Woesearchaeota archaeon]